MKLQSQQRKLELLCASQLNDTLMERGQEWGSSFSYSPHPLTPFVGLSLSRGCPHFLAAVYFICCKQNSAWHAPPPNTWRAICRRLAVQSSFSFLFSAFSSSSSFFLSLFSALWLVLHSALKMRFSCCSAQSLSRSSSAGGRGKG